MAQTENIFFVSPDGAQIKIEQAREAMHFLSLGREGRKLIMIFDQAQLMGPQAANALLKSVEEPPPGVHFIFLSPSPAMLLSTIRSRSQVVRFAPLLDEEVELVLHQQDRDLKVEPWLLEMASGSVSAALEIARGGDDSSDAVSAIVESLDRWLSACDPAVLSSDRLHALATLRESLKERDHHAMAFRVKGPKQLAVVMSAYANSIERAAPARRSCEPCPGISHLNPINRALRHRHQPPRMHYGSFLGKSGSPDMRLPRLQRSRAGY
jgi:replication-associated recombination protein RarA